MCGMCEDVSIKIKAQEEYLLIITLYINIYIYIYLMLLVELMIIHSLWSHLPMRFCEESYVREEVKNLPQSKWNRSQQLPLIFIVWVGKILWLSEKIKGKTWENLYIHWLIIMFPIGITIWAQIAMVTSSLRLSCWSLPSSYMKFMKLLKMPCRS